VSSPKWFRLLFAATVVAGVSAPMLGAYAGETRGVDVHDPGNGGFVVEGAEPRNRIDISIGDDVKWTVYDGKHNITPKDKGQWGGNGSEAELTQASAPYSKQFKQPNDYFYFCSIHSSADDVGKPGVGMWGVVHVTDPTPSTTTSSSPPVTSPPSTTPSSAPTGTTRPGPTTPATTATVPTTRAAPAAPAPTTSTAKGDKEKKPKDETTTTTTAPPPPIDLPDSAIIPTLPGSSTPSNAEPEAPSDTPEGEAVALLKSKKGNGGDAMMLLIVSGLGLGALGVGTAGYKYANRSSKYFPA
jgi:plastocyanin